MMLRNTLTAILYQFLNARLKIKEAVTLSVLAVLLSSCKAVGPVTLEAARPDYNDAIVRSNDRQLLLNLVRLRYRDTPFFMSVSNVTSRYTLSYNGSARIPDFEGNNIESSISLSGGGTFTESPTVVYNPVIGEQFIRELLTPIPPQNIALLAQSGWSIERILILCVQAMNNVFNAPSASGPTPSYAPQYEEFLELANLLRDIQVERDIELAVTENGDATLRFFPTDQTATLENTVKSILDIEPEVNEVIFSQNREYAGSWMRTRSPLGVMHFISQSIEVPEEHYQAGLATRTLNEDGSVFNWGDLTGRVIDIRSQRERPRDTNLAVLYRGWWFYIDEGDLNSKSSFNLFNTLLQMQSGRIETNAVINTISLD